MIVFAGFERGMRQNSIIQYDFNSKIWSEIEADKAFTPPQPRAGHSAVIYEDKLYIFGGKDEDNEKLRDFWSFDLNTKAWEQLECEEQSIISRSGHSACVFQDYMIICAGIHEVTKELDDLAAYSFKNKKWIHMFKDPV